MELAECGAVRAASAKEQTAEQMEKDAQVAGHLIVKSVTTGKPQLPTVWHAPFAQSLPCKCQGNVCIKYEKRQREHRKGDR